MRPKSQASSACAQARATASSDTRDADQRDLAEPLLLRAPPGRPRKTTRIAAASTSSGRK